jgi:hypothetical protein
MNLCNCPWGRILLSIGETQIKELSRTKGNYDHILTTVGNLEKINGNDGKKFKIVNLQGEPAGIPEMCAIEEDIQIPSNSNRLRVYDLQITEVF